MLVDSDSQLEYCVSWTFKHKCVGGVLLIAIAAQLACQKPLERHDWSGYEGPGAEHFQREEYALPYHEDPLEPVNRLTQGLNAGALILFIDPLATGWRYVVPQEARTGMLNMANNSEVIQHSVNHALQGNNEAAATNLERFGINTTAGVLGVKDAAAEQGITAQRTDTGMTLNHAGWRDSAFLVEPIGGPSTLRDALGGLGDLALDPFAWWMRPVLIGKGFVRGNEQAGNAKRLLTTNRDPYESMRRLYLAQREILDAPLTEPTTDSDASQTLNYLRFAPSDPFFAYEPIEGKAYIKMTRDELPFTAWIQEEAAPVVFLLPGFGGHRHTLQNIALAEVFFNAGYSVATISSAANFEFMRHAGATTYPGFGPNDAADVHAALDAVWRALRVEYGNRVLERALVGTSFGAFHTLMIAAREPVDAGGQKLIDFDAYLAICPPVQLRHAADQIDDYYNALMTFPSEERDTRAIVALKKANRLAFSGGGGVEFGATEAEFLVGLGYRFLLHDMIWECRHKREIPFLKTEWSELNQASASQEILDYSLNEYAYGVMLPYLRDEAQQVSDGQSMFLANDLRLYASHLQSDPRVGVFTNANDFLLSENDMAWLQKTIPSDRLIVRETGGHLGNMDDASVQSEIITLLKSLQTSNESVAIRP